MSGADERTHEDILASLRASDESTTDVVMSTVAGFEHVFEHIKRLEKRIAELERKTANVRSSGGKTIFGS